MPAAAQQVEAAHAVRPTDHDLTIDQEGSGAKPIDRLDDRREPTRPVMAAACDQPDASTVAPGHDPEAIVLDLMQPFRPLGRSGRRAWLARFNEAGDGPAGTRTQQGHAA